MSLRPVEIVGGGLAGLALGLSLRRAGADVTIFEAGHYPRHRVCGEFIAGLGKGTITRLELAPFFADARPLRDVEWFIRGLPVRQHRLPAPALALSRHTLDARLADAFTAVGGRLLTGMRVDTAETPVGRVFSTGRRRLNSPWLGLKLHARNLRVAGDLEVQLGDGAYVGVCQVEDGQVNVCGLFRQRRQVTAGRDTVLLAYLQATGLEALAARLAEAEICPDSCSAMAGVSFDRSSRARDRMNLGDTYAAIPPFTGNGMAMAFQSAELALNPLLAWVRGEISWDQVLALVHQRLRRRFRQRLTLANLLHPFLHSAPRQRWLAVAARSRLLPLSTLTRMLH